MTPLADWLRTPLADWLRWLGTPDCSCPWEWRSLGILYGVLLGKGWVRMATDSRCPHHGDADMAAR